MHWREYWNQIAKADEDKKTQAALLRSAALLKFQRIQKARALRLGKTKKVPRFNYADEDDLL